MQFTVTHQSLKHAAIRMREFYAKKGIEITHAQALEGLSMGLFNRSWAAIKATAPQAAEATVADIPAWAWFTTGPAETPFRKCGSNTVPFALVQDLEGVYHNMPANRRCTPCNPPRNSCCLPGNPGQFQAIGAATQDDGDNIQDFLCMIAREGDHFPEALHALGVDGYADLHKQASRWYKQFSSTNLGRTLTPCTVKVTLAVGTLEPSDSEDESVADTYYQDLYLPLECPYECEQLILDWFHNEVAIACLEDFDIEPSYRPKLTPATKRA